jgi:hypothetical protein
MCVTVQRRTAILAFYPPLGPLSALLPHLPPFAHSHAPTVTLHTSQTTHLSLFSSPTTLTVSPPSILTILPSHLAVCHVSVMPSSKRRLSSRRSQPTTSCDCVRVNGSRLLQSAVPREVIRQIIQPMTAWTSYEAQTQRLAVELWKRIPPGAPYQTGYSVFRGLHAVFIARVASFDKLFQLLIKWDVLCNYMTCEANAGL